MQLRGDYFKQLPILSTSHTTNISHPSEGVANVERIVPSPIVNGYRNKCEFSIGQHPESGKPVVGFRLSSYKKGSVAVVGIDHLPIVPDKVRYEG